MLARVGLDTGAIASVPADSLSVLLGIHRDLIELLVNHGVVVFVDEEDEAAFRGTLASLNVEVRKMWSTALNRIARTRLAPPAGTALVAVADTESFQRSWGGRIDVAFVAQAKAALLAPLSAEGSYIEPSTGIELADVTYPRASSCMRAMESRATADIPHNAAREQVFEERFRPVLGAARSLTIVDRYASVNLLGNRRPSQGAGEEWFLRRAGEAAAAALHLITSASSRSNAGTVRQRFCRLRESIADGISSFSITIADERTFRQYAHARHLRAGHRCIVMDRGLQLFDEHYVTQSTPFQLADPVAARQREADLESEAYVRREVLW